MNKNVYLFAKQRRIFLAILFSAQLYGFRSKLKMTARLTNGHGRKKGQIIMITTPTNKFTMSRCKVAAINAIDLYRSSQTKKYVFDFLFSF